MEKSFSGFRQEQYIKTASRGGRPDREYFEDLFDFLISPGEVSPEFRNSLLDLLVWRESGTPSVFPMEKILSLFSADLIYDRCFLNLVSDRPELQFLIPPDFPARPGELDEQKFLAWGRLLLEMEVREEFALPVSLFLEALREDDGSRVLQLALLARWKLYKNPGIEMAARTCLANLNRERELSGPMRIAPAGADGAGKDKIRDQIPFLKEQGILVFQFLFYGDPDSAGAGDSGGLATLMRDLGSALSEKDALAGVITICAYDTAIPQRNLVPLSFPAERHALVHLPLYLGESGKQGFLPSFGIIRQAMTGVFHSLDLASLPCLPVFHLRYLDGASEVLSLLAKEFSIPLVTTLTPDPHRRIIPAAAGDGSSSPGERLLRFYRVLVGDRLLERSGAIVGIGKNSIGTSLLSYYPALADPGKKTVRGIDEGIRLMDTAPHGDMEELFCQGKNFISIDSSRQNRPVILNVGRLNSAKGQYSLVRAWAEYGLWKTHNLFLIGGDFHHPSPGEKEVIRQILDYAAAHPELKGLLRFQPATANEEIRILQKVLASRDLCPYPDLYLCSSIKEEFGISVIEAMSAGLVVLAPLLGGAWEYIRHGINGFRIDTSTPESMGREFHACIYEGGITSARFKAMGKNAAQTIRDLYSLAKVADDFVQVYLKVSGKTRMNPESPGTVPGDQ